MEFKRMHVISYRLHFLIAERRERSVREYPPCFVRTAVRRGDNIIRKRFFQNGTEDLPRRSVRETALLSVADVFSNVAVREMKRLSQVLINVHGQRDYETLLHRSELLDILDLYSGGDTGKLLGDVSEKYHVMCELKDKLDEELSDTGSAEKEASLARVELDEIDYL